MKTQSSIIITNQVVKRKKEIEKESYRYWKIVDNKISDELLF